MKSPRRKPLKTQLEGYYTAKEAAEYLGVQARSAWNWAQQGTLKAVLVDGRYFIPSEVMHQFIKPTHGNVLFGEQSRHRARIRKAIEKTLSRAERVRQARGLFW